MGIIDLKRIEAGKHGEKTIFRRRGERSVTDNWPLPLRRERRGSSSLQFYFKTAIRVTAFLQIESLIYSIFTLSPISGGLESTKVL